MIEHSQAVMLDAASYISMDVQVLNRSGTPGTFKIQVQKSNDLENWYPVDYPPAIEPTGDPEAAFQPTGSLGDPVTARFVRLQYTLVYNTEAVTVALAAGINVAPV